MKNIYKKITIKVLLDSITAVRGPVYDLPNLAVLLSYQPVLNFTRLYSFPQVIL